MALSLCTYLLLGGGGGGKTVFCTDSCFSASSLSSLTGPESTTCRRHSCASSCEAFSLERLTFDGRCPKFFGIFVPVERRRSVVGERTRGTRRSPAGATSAYPFFLRRRLRLHFDGLVIIAAAGLLLELPQIANWLSLLLFDGVVIPLAKD